MWAASVKPTSLSLVSASTAAPLSVAEAPPAIERLWPNLPFARSIAAFARLAAWSPFVLVRAARTITAKSLVGLAVARASSAGSIFPGSRPFASPVETDVTTRRTDIVTMAAQRSPTCSPRVPSPTSSPKRPPPIEAARSPVWYRR